MTLLIINNEVKVINDNYTQRIVSTSDYDKDINENQIHSIENDIYIEEAFKIMLDYINLEK